MERTEHHAAVEIACMELGVQRVIEIAKAEGPWPRLRREFSEYPVDQYRHGKAAGSSTSARRS